MCDRSVQRGTSQYFNQPRVTKLPSLRIGWNHHQDEEYEDELRRETENCWEIINLETTSKSHLFTLMSSVPVLGWHNTNIHFTEAERMSDCIGSHSQLTPKKKQRTQDEELYYSLLYRGTKALNGRTAIHFFYSLQKRFVLDGILLRRRQRK